MSDASPVRVVFLRDVERGGDAHQLATVAAELAGFIVAARTSVDIAIYDFRLSDLDAAGLVVSALLNAADRGLSVRIAYDAGKPDDGTAADFARLQADPAPIGTADWVTEHFTGTAVSTKPITTTGDQLMHSKYVIRDASPADTNSDSTNSDGTNSDGTIDGAGPAVWTGSTNFTDDAWTRQENNIITIADAALVAAYRTDFDQMWTAGAIHGTGAQDTGTDTLPDAAVLGWDFCPGDGAAVNAALAARITAATSRLIVASMVVTSHQVLAALAAAIGRGIPVTGIYDGGQMDPIVAQWRANSHDTQVVADWDTVSAVLVHKQSTPYTPTSVHDFMHLKVLIADNDVTTGSYNFSANAERNAENQIHLTDPDTVTAYANYINTVITAYT